MSLDPRYILMSGLQEYFVDKDTGLPLVAGIVTFYSDINRTLYKNIYRISGTPPNYTYIALPNPLTLSSVGTIQDGSGNDVLPYYFPYDVSGNVENYYITIDAASISPPTPGPRQFTREGIPNYSLESSNAEEIKNYIPNPQFLMRTNVPATLTAPIGTISQAHTVIGAGGWSFDRPNSSTATDIVTFVNYNSAILKPTGNPRHAVRVQCTAPNAGDTYKDIRLTFNSVNTFSSEDQEYTFYFEGNTNNGSSANISLVLRKFFGTGGSPSAPQETVLTTWTVGTTSASYQFPFIFGINTSDTLGTNGDDDIELCLRLPTNIILEIQFTDFVLTPDNILLTVFPTQTVSEMVYKSNAGGMPVPDLNGMDYYLPIVNTPSGYVADSSSVGSIIASLKSSHIPGCLLMNGSSFLVSGYSVENIPYRRLFNALYDSTNNIFQFGSGPLFLNAYKSATTNLFILTTNIVGSTTVVSNGVIGTGFTFSPAITGSAGFGVNAYNYVGSSTPGATGLFVVNLVVGAFAAPAAATSGFTISVYRTGNAKVQQIFTVGVTSVPAAGTYFTFSSASGNYYMWFRVNGAGADPAPGGTGIRVDLLSTYTAADIATIIKEAILGHQVASISTIGGAGIVAGAYFNFYTPTAQYYAYYIVDGVNNDPHPAGATYGVSISISSSATAAQVCTATILALNSVYLLIPDIRGQFIRGMDPTALIDPNITIRMALTPNNFGAKSGNFEFDTLASHLHSITDPGHLHSIVDPSHLHAAEAFTAGTADQNGFVRGGLPDIGGISTTAAVTGITINSNTTGITGTTVTGNDENRPLNFSVNWFIKI